MRTLKFIPLFLSSGLMAAHFLRSGEQGLVAVSLSCLVLLFFRRPWVPIVWTALLLVGAAIWVDTCVGFVQIRMMLGQDWIRMAVIIGAVAAFTAAGALVFRGRELRGWYGSSGPGRTAGAVAFFGVAGLMAVVHHMVHPSMLVLERLWPSGGWFQIFVLACYAAFVTEAMLDVQRAPVWRRRIWVTFSVVFFGQIALGILDFDLFLLSGELHVPVPAVIVAGPLFRGEGLFMVILFISTAVLVGPAWCSHLCYIGAWDQVASDRRKRPGQLPPYAGRLRVGIFAAVILCALGFRLFGVSPMEAAVVALGFGGVGILVMLVWSRRAGFMAHCTVFCPMGLLADAMGKISPFRLKIEEGCDGCMGCSKMCRYGALSKNDIAAKKPAATCTLCLDCLAGCRGTNMKLAFLGKTGPGVRVAFVTLVVVLHAVFLGVAMF